ncbi:MAG: prolyl oligopeptidase family serine peptidase [Acidobacteriota bacterium]
MPSRSRSAFLSSLLVLALTLAVVPTGQAAASWQSPPSPIDRILDAELPPQVSFSPDRRWMAELSRPSLPPMAELAAPIVKVAGTRLDPRTNGPAREYAYTSLSLRPLERGPSRRVALPADARIRNLRWAPDRDRLSFTLTGDTGIELWVVDVPNGQPRRLTGPVLNATMGNPCDWLPGDDGLVCLFVPGDRGAVPAEQLVPDGPVIEESSGRKAPARTYQNLLASPRDEALMEHYMTSTVEQVSLSGERRLLVEPGLVADVAVSPDGRYLLVETVHRPYSYQVPMSRFPLRSEVLDRDGRQVHLVSDLPLAESVPMKFGSTRTGRRSIGWRSDAPATLAWVEALDGGDAGRKAEVRDAVYLHEAPFRGEPRLLWKSELRFGGVTWGRDDVALVSEWWFDTRTTRTWKMNPSNPSEPFVKVEDRNYQDAYADPGNPVMERGRYGRSVIKLDASGDSMLLTGRGASPEGVHPFLDRMDLTTGKTERLWRSADPHYESVVAVLDDKGKRFITRRQSRQEPPNYFLRKGRKRAEQLTFARDHAPELAGLQKELLRYDRADGVELSATLYLPPGHDPKRDGPLPTVFWAYPREFKSKKTASQVTTSENTFSRPGGSSVMFLLTQGYAVLSGPTMPIIGEGDVEPNDTFVEQLVTSAEAAVEKVVSMGVADRDRIAIGGHSYGAFTAVHLLAHTDLFRAGIARSGAYNRTLTPFGFQGEQRSFWQATDTYVKLSPFSHAAKVDEPLLLTHGADDSNSGTYPVQSERLYRAIKGLGGTVRWVVLPNEDHGYRSREAVGHVLWEMTEWLNRHVKTAPPRESKPTGTSAM